MDGSGSPVPDGLSFSPGLPSTRSGSFAAPPAPAAFSGLAHPLAGTSRLAGGAQASEDGGPNISSDFALSLAAPGSGPGVMIRSASRSDSGTTPW